MMSDNFWQFLTPHPLPNVQFLPSNVRLFGVISDPHPPLNRTSLMDAPLVWSQQTQQDTALRPAPEKSTFRNSDFDLKSNLFKFGPFWSNLIQFDPIFFLHFPLFHCNKYSKIPVGPWKVQFLEFGVRFETQFIQVWSSSNLISFKIILLKHFPQFNHNKCTTILHFCPPRKSPISEVLIQSNPIYSSLIHFGPN